MKRRPDKTSQERSINQDLEESLPSYRKVTGCGQEDGGFKGNKKVDFYLEATPEQQRSHEAMNGSAGGGVEDFLNPYTDNLYVNINVNNTSEVMEELGQQSVEQISSTGGGATTNREQ